MLLCLPVGKFSELKRGAQTVCTLQLLFLKFLHRILNLSFRISVINMGLGGMKRRQTRQNDCGPFTINWVGSRAYRAAEGGERACNTRSPYVDGEIQHVTKNKTSSHAREC